MSDKPWWREPLVVLLWRQVRVTRELRGELRSAHHAADAYKAECCVYKQRAKRYQQLAVRSAAGNPQAMDAVLWQIQSDDLADLPEIEAPRSAP
jgi:hypothetical protein